MEFNLQRYTTAINVLLIIAIAYFASLSVSDIISIRLAGNVVPPEGISGQTGVQFAANHPLSYYDAIVHRDIFNLKPAPVVAPPVVHEDLRITLLGTSQLTVGSPFAIIENENGVESLYRLGDTIPNVGKILAITRDEAIIDHNGRRVAITIPNQQMPATMMRPMRPAFGRVPYINNPMIRHNPWLHKRKGGVRKMGANAYVIQRSTVNRNLKNMAELFTQIRAVPDIHNGKSSGFQLSEIQPGSIFQQIGLKNGDVLTSVEGQSMTDPTQAIQVLESLRNRSSISLEVLRNGTPVQLHYQIN